MRSDFSDVFPDPDCVFDGRLDVLWLDCVKLRRILDEETAYHFDLFCTMMIDELHELKRQSNLPYLSKSDLMRELEDPKFGLVPFYQEELRVLGSNLQAGDGIVHAYSQRSLSQNHPICDGGNYFTSVGHETGLSPHLKDSWRYKLETKVQYGTTGSERERNFRDAMISALELLHSRSRLDNLNGEQWRNYWRSFGFEKCEDIKTRGMIKNIAVEVVSLNDVGGSQFSELADKALSGAPVAVEYSLSSHTKHGVQQIVR